MANFSFMPTSSLSDDQENDDDGLCITNDVELPLLFAFQSVACLLGLLGNGAVIWLLGFRMERTQFTIYVLNLAVADFGVLLSLISMTVQYVLRRHIIDDVIPNCLHLVNIHFFRCAYSISQFLLAAISIDRCVAVLFPLWHRCRRPQKLSTVLCALIWLLNFLVQGICLTFLYTGEHNFPPLFYIYLVNAMVCLPLITVSTLVLFVRFCFKSRERQRGKLITAILLTLVFFIIFAFPFNVTYLIAFSPYSSDRVLDYLVCHAVPEYGWLLASLNSFVNPLLYFLVGRKKRSLCRENLKVILQRVFREEEDCRGEPETQLSSLQKPLPQEDKV